MKTRFTTYHNPEVWQERRYADTASGKWYRAPGKARRRIPSVDPDRAAQPYRAVGQDLGGR
jgi:hypothetical protein